MTVTPRCCVVSLLQSSSSSSSSSSSRFGAARALAVCTRNNRYAGDYKNGERVGASHMVLKTQGSKKQGRLKLKVFGF